MSDQPIFSFLTSKIPTSLWKCQNNTCSESIANLCELSPLNPCPYESFYSCSSLQFASFIGQNESGGEVPSAIFCCSDLGFGWGFSQAFLNEQNWNLSWCANHDNKNCGYHQVNDYNRCQYLMYIYGPTENGDYCDRIDMYINNSYDVLTLPATCQ